MPPLHKENDDSWILSNELETTLAFALPSKTVTPLTLRKRKSIRFDMHREIHEIPSVNSLWPSEITSLWYTKHDFQFFAKEVLRTVHLVTHFPNEVDDIEYTSRGTETRMHQNYFRRKHNITSARAFVLKAQKENRSDSYIANGYCQISESTNQEAILKANNDERFCREETNQVNDAFSTNWLNPAPTYEPKSEKKAFGIKGMWISRAIFA